MVILPNYEYMYIKLFSIKTLQRGPLFCGLFTTTSGITLNVLKVHVCKASKATRIV